MEFQVAKRTDRQPDRHRGTIAPKRSVPPLSPAQLILPLQRSIGNRAVQRVLESRRIQPKNAGAWPDIRGAAARGVKGGGTSLPHLERIAAAFGPGHDLLGVQAHVGGDAGAAARDAGALGYTMGEHVAFAGPPDLKLAAHEAAHVVQQRTGVRLPDGIGRPNDPHERMAEAVSERVEAGQAAWDLLPRAARASVPDPASQERLPLIETLRHVLGPRRAPVGPPIQFALVDTLKGMLDIYGPVDYDGLIRAVRAAPVAERQAVLNDAATVSRIRSRFSGVWATSIMSSLLEGSQTWANPPATDFYAYFVTRSATGTPPSFSATMNCWESIMYAAYLAGVLSASWIKTYYVSAGAIPGTVTDPTPALWAQLGFSTSLPRYDPAATPPRVPSVGQLVFYLPSGAAIPAHVAVFMGGGEVVSLWTQPAGIRQVQRVPITSFAGAIYFGNAPW